MPVHYNDNKIGKIFYNNDVIKKAYIGVNQVFTNKIEHIFINPKNYQDLNLYRYNKKNNEFVSQTLSASNGNDSIAIGDYVVTSGVRSDNSTIGVVSVSDLRGREVYRLEKQGGLYDEIRYDSATGLIYFLKKNSKSVEIKRLEKGVLIDVSEQILGTTYNIENIDLYGSLLVALNGYDITVYNTDFSVKARLRVVSQFDCMKVLGYSYIAWVEDSYLKVAKINASNITQTSSIPINFDIGNSNYIALGNDNRIYLIGNNGLGKYSYANGKLSLMKLITRSSGSSQAFVKNDPEGFIYVSNYDKTVDKFDYELKKVATFGISHPSATMVIN